MSLFSDILAKLGIGPAGAAPTPDASAPAPVPGPGADLGVPGPVGPIDVAAKLDDLNVGKGLNWQTSIVDLLKLLGLDSSLEARRKLAAELGCPAEKLTDSAHMNVWLSKAVLNKLAANGGVVPADLLD